LAVSYDKGLRLVVDGTFSHYFILVSITSYRMKEQEGGVVVGLGKRCASCNQLAPVIVAVGDDDADATADNSRRRGGVAKRRCCSGAAAAVDDVPTSGATTTGDKSAVATRNSTALLPLTNRRQTRLHRLCEDPQVSVKNIQRCLDAHDGSGADELRTQDHFGRTPLFYAIKRGCSADVVGLLFDAYPEGITETDMCGENGLSLLYYFDKCPSLLQLLLGQKPELVFNRSSTFSAPTLLERVVAPWSSMRKTPSTGSGVAWRKLVITVRAAHRVVFDDDNNDFPAGIESDSEGRELHVALELLSRGFLSTSIVSLFIQHYPWQARAHLVREGSIILPLHFAITTRNDKLSNSEKGALVRQLIMAYPDAALCPSVNGSYPLHLALADGLAWQDGVKDLVYAGHDALHCVDPVTGLYPFMIAASASEANQNMDTIFALLRECPTPFMTN